LGKSQELFFLYQITNAVEDYQLDIQQIFENSKRKKRKDFYEQLFENFIF